MAEGLAPILVPAALCCSHHEGAVLNGPGPEQHMPMCLPRLAGEGGGYRKHFRPSQRLGTEKLRKTQVVADSQAEPDAGQIDDRCLRARLIGRRFTPTLAAVEIHVEHVYLVVSGDALASGRIEQGTVCQLAVGAHDSGRADMQEDAKLPRKPPCGGYHDILVLARKDFGARLRIAH